MSKRLHGYLVEDETMGRQKHQSSLYSGVCGFSGSLFDVTSQSVPKILVDKQVQKALLYGILFRYSNGRRSV